MKRKIQHNAVNNQEDEDSCASPMHFPSDTPVEKKEDKSDDANSRQLSGEASTNKDGSASNRE